ncbi:MAG: tetratricopeptide repeat protein [Pseudomonadota bacterium]
MRLLRILIVTWIGLTLPLGAFARDVQTAPFSWPKSAAAFRTLPKYCAVRLGYPAKNQSVYLQYKKRYGKHWEDMHHYCNALNAKFLAPLQSDPNRRKKGWTLAEAESDYVFRRGATPQTWSLYPQALMVRGRARLELGKTAAGIRDLNQAMRLRPKSSAPYLELSRYYQKIGKNDKAMAIVERGLKNAPKSRALKRAKQRLAKKTG